MGDKAVKVHLLDCGAEEYGDALLLQLGEVTVLVDGAHPADWQETGEKHPGLPAQIRKLLGGPQPPYQITLLIVSHAHEDHIGCLPKLVADKTIKVEWALVIDPDHGWAANVGDDDAMDARTQQVLAGLREEEFKERPGGRTVEEFLVDAANLESKYRQMIVALEKAGTTVVRYGTDDHAALVKAIKKKGVTMKIVGPSLDQLEHTVELLAKQLGFLHDAAAEIGGMDAELTAAEIFTDLVAAADAKSRAGHLVNAMSLVTHFQLGDKKILLTGDMQLAAPSGDKALKDEVVGLRERIEKLGPYDFVKLAHHGSDNGFNTDILDEMQPKILGICAGEQSEKHPAKPVLELLKKHQGDLQWMRTDRWGGCTIDLTEDEPTLKPEDGINDPQANIVDDAGPPEGELVEEHEGKQRGGGELEHRYEGEHRGGGELERFRRPPEVQVEHVDGDFVEVTARLPLRKATVSITIAVDPDEAALQRTGGYGAYRGGGSARGRQRQLQIASGRDLSGILFVTNAEKLARRIPAQDVRDIVAALRAVPGTQLIDDAGGNNAEAVAADIAKRRSGRPRGVVIIGGHEVIPHQAVKVAPQRLLDRIDGFRDLDDFIVWSDDIYGSLDDDHIAEVPVSRIPDAGDPDLLWAALSAPFIKKPTSRGGIRNLARPFAAEVYRQRLRAGRGPRDLQSSSPLGKNGVPPLVASESLYLMLHGDRDNGRVFAGEDEGSNLIEAVDIEALPPTWSGTVFAGCCWGALTTQRPAIDGDSPSRTRDQSLALTFLSRGANAFIGCTGAHWSPTIPPFNYFGGPMHSAFWDAYGNGMAPAAALFEAKKKYVTEGFPHKLPSGKRTPASVALEYKTWRQFTCLGLGW